MDHPLSVTVRRASEITGIGKTTIYKLFKEQKLTRIKVGRRTLVSVPQLSALVQVGE